VKGVGASEEWSDTDNTIGWNQVANMDAKAQIVIIVSTPPCDKCAACKKMAQELMDKFGPAVEVQILDAFDPAADIYGVLLTPTMIVGDTVVSVGRAPRREAVERLVQDLVAGDGPDAEG
jgi:hypothetical protein